VAVVTNAAILDILHVIVERVQAPDAAALVEIVGEVHHVVVVGAGAVTVLAETEEVEAGQRAGAPVATKNQTRIETRAGTGVRAVRRAGTGALAEIKIQRNARLEVLHHVLMGMVLLPHVLIKRVLKELMVGNPVLHLQQEMIIKNVETSCMGG